MNTLMKETNKTKQKCHKHDDVTGHFNILYPFEYIIMLVKTTKTTTLQQHCKNLR